KGAAASRCFKRSEWEDDALKQPTNSNDPVCGTPAPTTNFCDDPGPSGTPTATAARTNTPTPTGGTPASTPTRRATPTNTATRATPGPRRQPRSGGATGPGRAPGRAPRTPPPSTPRRRGGGTPTATISPSPPAGALIWVVAGSPTPNVGVPKAGMNYPQT